jgi:para-nitrobenzyl esterase
MSRTRWMLAVGLMASSVGLLTARADGGPEAKTSAGKIVGKMSADGAIREFLGVPYAAPPVGTLRWRAPQASAKWPGTKATTDFGSRCMQPNVNADMIFHDPGQSEDCLTLNVWAPKASKGAKLPVMVWIYGAGLQRGARPRSGRMESSLREMALSSCR